MPITAAGGANANPSLANFLTRHWADLTDAMAPAFPDLLRHLFRLYNHSELPRLFELSPGREMAVSLLELLKRSSMMEKQEHSIAAATDDHQKLLMAFFCALLHSGQLRLFCRILTIQLVDSHNLEQFARANDNRDFIFPKNWKSPSEVPDLTFCVPLEKRRDFVLRHVELIKLRLDQADTVADLLTQWGLLGEEQFKEIQNVQDKSAKNGLLLSTLLLPAAEAQEEEKPKPLHTFECLCLCLLLTKQLRLFSILHEPTDLGWLETAWKAFLTENNDENLGYLYGLPFDNNSSKLATLSTTKISSGTFGNFEFEVETVDSAPPSDWSEYLRRKEDIYPNFSSPKGLALVISNHRFHGREPRYGAEVDEQKVVSLWTNLDYKVVLETNLSAEEMFNALQKFAARREHAWMASAIVTVMTHGHYDCLEGVDGVALDFHQFVECMNAERAPLLARKPKIFIVQACRGENRDYGVLCSSSQDAVDGAKTDGWLSWFRSSGRANNNKRKGPLTMSFSPSPSFTGASSPPLCSSSNSSSGRRQFQPARPKAAVLSKEPTSADILIAHSTTPHFVAWRNNVRGSWFIQSLCQVFSQCANREDIESLLRRVREEVSKREGGDSPKTGSAKQVSETTSRLRKKFYFFPGVRSWADIEHLLRQKENGEHAKLQ